MRVTKLKGTTIIVAACSLIAATALFAQEPVPPALPEKTPGEKPAEKPSLEPPPILDPTPQLDPQASPALPNTPSPQIESITLFPDQQTEEPVSVMDDKWHLVLHGAARATYDSNIFISNQNQQEDFYFTVAAGIAIGRGDFKTELFDLGSFRDRFLRDRAPYQEEKTYFFLNYIPSYTFFADHSEEDTFNHDVTLEGKWVLPKITLGGRARFVTENVADQDLGQRVERQIFTTGITMEYNLSPKTSFELNPIFVMRDYEPATSIDVNDLRVPVWFNYQSAPKVNVGLGAAYGHVWPSSNLTQSYWQALARARYKATEKFQLQAAGGVEFRDNGSFGNTTNPVFSISASYTPFDGTSIYLTGYSRTATSSSAPGLNYTMTGVDLQIRQRFRQRYYVALATGYQNADYDNLANSGAPKRKDDSFYIRPAVGIDITKSFSVEASFEYRDVDSTNEFRTWDRALAYVQGNLLF